jgi:hypothetical protein
MDDITASIIVACQTDGATAAVDKLKYSFAQLARQAYNFGKDAIRAYSDLQEETQKFGLVFEKMNHQAKRYVKDLVDNFGQSELSARKMMSSTGDLLKGWEFEDKYIVEMSGAVARLGADIASFSNYSGGATNATIALTKAMLGETEMAKMLGVAIKTDSPEFKKLEKQALSTGVTIDKLGKSFKAETASQAKAVAAFATMYQQKGYVLGDFKRNQDSIANSARLLDNRFQDLKTTVGDFLDSFINASGINKGLAGAMKSITDTINKNKVSWGLQIKTVFIEIEFSLKRVGQVLSPLIDAFGTLFERIKAIGTLMTKTSPLEVLKNAALDFAEYTTPVGWGRLLAAAVNEKRLNDKWGGEEGRILENLRRAGEGDSSRVEDEFLTFADIGNRLNDMAEKFDVKMPSFKPLKFDFDFSKLDKEKKKALEDAEESFRRRYVDEAKPEGKKDGKNTVASFGPVITADIAKAINTFRATAQSAIDANSLEGMRLQSRRLSLGKPEDWTKKTADGVSKIVDILKAFLPKGKVQSGLENVSAMMEPLLENVRDAWRQAGQNMNGNNGGNVSPAPTISVPAPAVKVPAPSVITPPAPAVNVRVPSVKTPSVTVQAPESKAQADFSWGQRTADGVATIVGQLREIGKSVMQKSAVTVRPQEVRAGDTSVTVQAPDGKAQADFSWGQRTADGVATIVGQLREIGKSVAVPPPTALRLPEMPRPAASVPVIAPRIQPAGGQGQSPVVWSEILAQLKALVAQASNTTGDVEIIARQVSNISTNGLKMSLNTRKY